LPLPRREPNPPVRDVHPERPAERRLPMGRGILLWLLGVPIPIIILILLFWH
jgi:hypothetical protein